MKRFVVTTAVAAAMVGAVAGCGSDSDSPASDTRTVDTTSAPEQVRWEQWQGVSVPVSSEDGPRTVEGAVVSGYSHGPQGAVLAAAQAVTRLRLAPDEAWPQVANTVAAPGRGRDQYAVNRVQVSITGPVPSGTGVVVPFSTSDGPATVEGLAARGFAHSPQGAALAGWQIFFRVAASNNEVGREIYDSQVVMSKDMREQINARLDAEGPYYRSATEQQMTYFGRGSAFRVQEYQDDLAVVEYAFRDVPGTSGTDRWSVARVVMVWVDGDWKLQYPDTGVFEAGTVDSLDGWTPW